MLSVTFTKNYLRHNQSTTYTEIIKIFLNIILECGNNEPIADIFSGNDVHQPPITETLIALSSELPTHIPLIQMSAQATSKNLIIIIIKKLHHHHAKIINF